MATARTDQTDNLVNQILTVIAEVMRARRNQQFDEAQRLLSNASLETLGIEHRALMFLSVADLCERLETPERIRACAKLVLAEAQLALAQGRWDDSERMQTRALSLVAAADARGGPTEFPQHV